MSVIREIEKERERERKISFGALLRLKRERESRDKEGSVASLHGFQSRKCQTHTRREPSIALDFGAECENRYCYDGMKVHNIGIR